MDDARTRTGDPAPPSAPLLRLPKTIEADPRAAELLLRIDEIALPLWSGASHRAACVTPGPELRTVLQTAQQSGFVVRGLETAERRLAAEERGLNLVRADAPRETGVRISRLLLFTNDASERFHRSVEALLKRHSPRLLAIRLDVNEHELGESLYGPGRVARLVLVEHKNAVAGVLLAIADGWRDRPTTI